jgi:hypothetical protein
VWRTSVNSASLRRRAAAMRTYRCKRASVPPRLDGRVTDDPHGWDTAQWTEPFGDILADGPRPYLATRVKLRMFTLCPRDRPPRAHPCAPAI